MWNFKNCAVIVAHPDDETLWAGGTILLNSEVNWEIISLTRKSDRERSLKFFKVLKELNAKGDIGDLDDGVEQNPLEIRKVEKMVLHLLKKSEYDLIITHSIKGEYQRHKRHEETGRAVLSLWEKGNLVAREFWMFAYEDGEGKYYPGPISDADVLTALPEKIWNKKFKIIKDVYGYPPEGWEVKTTPKKEAFWRFKSVAEAREKLRSN
jgi:LmbE family N-acetylglucosaminyl deacetylase